jgi:hypothetical protein
VQVETPDPLRVWVLQPAMVVPLSVKATVPVVTAEPPAVTVAL